jgi:hypothetical protein
MSQKVLFTTMAVVFRFVAHGQRGHGQRGRGSFHRACPGESVLTKLVLSQRPRPLLFFPRGRGLLEFTL